MGLFGSLLKTVIDVVETPVAIVKDVATMGGELTDQKKCYTQQKLEEIEEDWGDTKEQIKKL
jgi:hypothetical protein